MGWRCPNCGGLSKEAQDFVHAAGTGLKPCWEPILVIRKPLAKKHTLADNVLTHGTGALNIDACRVKHASPADFEAHKAGVEAIKARGGSMQNSWKNSSDLSGANDVTSAGRWPSNVLVVHTPACALVGLKRFKGSGTSKTFHEGYEGESATGFIRGHSHPGNQHGDADGLETSEHWECVPGCPAAVLDEQSGNRPGTLAGRADPGKSHDNPGDNGGASTFGGGNSRVYADEGGASRYYPQFDGTPFYYVGKATPREASLDGELENDHPCLHPDAEVLTESGYRAIGTIAPGDKVYAADGRFHTVDAVTRHAYTSPALFEISVGPYRKSLPTDNHPFLIWRPKKKGNSIIGSEVLWLRADQIKRGDYTMTPVLADDAGTAPPGLPDDPEFWFNMSSAPEGAGIGDRRFKSTQPCFQLNFSEGRGHQPNRVTYEGVEYTLRFVTQVRPVPYVGDVVNLSVEGSPTFQTTVGMSHNTKKPVRLMQWLIRLVTPKGGHVLDPYCGSGSTLHAAIEEDCVFTGIEKDPKFHAISVKRVAIVSANRQDLMTQKSLFALAMGEFE